MVAATLTSAAGLLALLDEPEPQIRAYALGELDKVVDVFWPEIAESIGIIEVLYEDEQFTKRQLAALVASKVYHHLGELDDAVSFALAAGDLFDIDAATEYTETIVNKCIDQYIASRRAADDGQDAVMEDALRPRLEAIAQRMFERCLHTGALEQAVGIALESRRLDVVEQCVRASRNAGKDPRRLLVYAQECSAGFDVHYRNEVLRLIVSEYQNLDDPDHRSVCQCFVFLSDFGGAARFLDALVRRGDMAMACQIAFDLNESATQDFLRQLVGALRKEPVARDSIERLCDVLLGEPAVALHLEFLHRANHTDLMILQNTKEAIGRNSVHHNATVVANALMHAGTAIDTFLRDNLDWLKLATNWAQFTAVASLGVIHKGQIKDSRALLDPYLPKGEGGSVYTSGGALYALGLIHQNHGAGVTAYLVEQLRAAKEEVVQHGAALGLGLAAMASHDAAVFHELRSVLYSDSAIAGEAAGLAIGLVMMGSMSSEVVHDMLAYAHETQHEKIIRGVGIGIALVAYGQAERAELLIAQLDDDKDPILRAAGVQAVATAYAGTASNRAVARLLHVAVSDVNDDVRRTAVISLGFVLLRAPKQVPQVVQLLVESYNPHVRYGAAMALGISCAASGMPDAIALLETLTTDPIDYVRQGAMVAMALVLQQQSPAQTPKATSARRLFERVIADKHEDTMAKYGAILAQGLLEAGGRNMAVRLATRQGHVDQIAVVGMLVFTQTWYWYPLAHFASLALRPMALIGLTVDLKMPDMQWVCKARASRFAYPPALQPPKEKEKNKVSTAILSVTAKAKARARKKDASKMDVDHEGAPGEVSAPAPAAAPPPPAEDKGAAPAAAGDAEPNNAKGAVAKEDESDTTLLDNPAHVVPDQVPLMAVPEGCRYEPAGGAESALTGIVVLRNRRPGEEERFVEARLPKPDKPASSASGETADEGEEPEPPEPFEYTDD